MIDVSPSVYDFEAVMLTGSPITLDVYRGKVLLIVNVASQCGFTGQYRGLEDLYRRHRDQGLVVLGFPCNQFGGQEPGSHADIQEFCTETYDITFPIFAKVSVNGRQAHPLFNFLKASQKGWLGTEAIKWNFTKFLVDREGRVLKRYGSSDAPDTIEPDIVRALA